MKLSAAVSFGLLALPAVSAFTPMATSRSQTALGMTDSLNMANSLAGANEQKAAAIRAAEARNQAEIAALKAQIAQIEDLFNRSPNTYSPTPPSLPPDVAGMDKNQLQVKLEEFKNYLGTLLQRSADNQKQVASLTGGSGIAGAVGTAAVAGSMGALVTNALDSNRRDSIGGIIAGAAGSVASSFSKPSSAPVAAPAPADPKAQVRRQKCIGSAIWHGMELSNASLCCTL